MPVINVQIGGVIQAPDGKQIPIAPQMVLAQQGPRLQVVIHLAEKVAQELLKRKESLPDPKPGMALIDTGALGSCVDEELAKEMNLPIIGEATLASASHASHKANLYPIKLAVQGAAIQVDFINAIGAPLKVQGLVAIIGRDLLANSVFVYNGPMGLVSLCL